MCLLLTVQALSPLFTVAAYALLFGVSYSAETYLSLLPLTVGVMLACSFDVSASNAAGLLCAFGSALVFVSQNIFFKKVVPHGSGTSHNKLDKLNLLFYSSGMAFLLMVPIWMYYDLPVFLSSSSSSAGHVAHPAHPSTNAPVLLYLLANGTVHFLQNVLAFVLLARTSPVTYSIASLVKRVAVICAAVLWFAQRVHALQAAGIALTFVGLWMYNRAVKRGEVERGERRVRRVERAWEGGLPVVRGEVESESEVEGQVAVGKGAEVQLQAQQQLHARSPLRTHAPTYSQTHPHAHPNLHIQIAPHPPLAPPRASAGLGVPASASAKEPAAVVSPTESYPSPPPSLDSPPATSAVESPWQQHAPMKKRRGTLLASHGHRRTGEGLGGFGDVPRTALVTA